MKNTSQTFSYIKKIKPFSTIQVNSSHHILSFKNMMFTINHTALEILALIPNDGISLSGLTIKLQKQYPKFKSQQLNETCQLLRHLNKAGLILLK